MARKVFQDFAHVMCQKFVEVPSNRDLLNLAILGGGRLHLDILGGRATHNDLAIEPLPFAASWIEWAMGRMTELGIPSAELSGAALDVQYTVDLRRKPGLGWLCADYDFSCTGSVVAPDKQYSSTLKAHREWGLSCV